MRSTAPPAGRRSPGAGLEAILAEIEGMAAAERSSMSPAPNSVLHLPRCLGGRRPHVLGVRSASRALDAAVNNRLAKWRDYSMDSTH